MPTVKDDARDHTTTSERASVYSRASYLVDAGTLCFCMYEECGKRNNTVVGINSYSSSIIAVIEDSY